MFTRRASTRGETDTGQRHPCFCVNYLLGQSVLSASWFYNISHGNGPGPGSRGIVSSRGTVGLSKYLQVSFQLRQPRCHSRDTTTTVALLCYSVLIPIARFLISSRSEWLSLQVHPRVTVRAFPTDIMPSPCLYKFRFHNRLHTVILILCMRGRTRAQLAS